MTESTSATGGGGGGAASASSSSRPHRPHHRHSSSSASANGVIVDSHAAAAAAVATPVHSRLIPAPPVQYAAAASAPSHPPSKVLHLRGLPPHATESDLLAFLTTLCANSSIAPLPVTRILLLPNSNQAFMQFASVDAAATFLSLQQTQPGAVFMIKSHKGGASSGMIAQFSNRTEIHTPTQLQHQQPQPQTSQAHSHTAGLTSHSPPLPGTHTHSNSTDSSLVDSLSVSSSGAVNTISPPPNRILLITVLNTRVPVTLDHLHQILSPYGEVRKIITFHKNGIFKALVQLGTIESSIAAREALEGKDIFQGCCHLRIGYSSLLDLHVKVAGNNARDFTTPSGASIGYEGNNGFHTTTMNGHAQQQQQQQVQQSNGPVNVSTSNGVYHAQPIQQPQQQQNGLIQQNAMQYQQQQHQQQLHQQQQQMVSNQPIHVTQQGGQYIQHGVPMQHHQQQHQQHQNVVSYEHTYQNGGGMHSGLPQQQPQMNGSSPLNGNNANGNGAITPGCVILVSNLPVGMTCDLLFTLFGVYGDIRRVKLLYNKRDTALIQYFSPHSAYLSCLHLNHLLLDDKQLSVTPSKHIEVSLPKPINHGHAAATAAAAAAVAAALAAAAAAAQSADQDGQLGLTQDYTHSPIHRFKRSGGVAAPLSVNGIGLGIHAKSIHPPSQVLHVSSLADCVTEEELRDLFAKTTVSIPAAAAASSVSSTRDAAAHGGVTGVKNSTATTTTSSGLSSPASTTTTLQQRHADGTTVGANAIDEEHKSNDASSPTTFTIPPPVVQFFTSAPTSSHAQPQQSSRNNNNNKTISKQAFLRFDSVASAVHALLQWHNYNLHGRYLRISFSGKAENQVHPTVGGVTIEEAKAASDAATTSEKTAAAVVDNIVPDVDPLSPSLADAARVPLPTPSPDSTPTPTAA